MAEHYKCAICTNEYPASEIQVDHILPVITSAGFTTWDDYIERMFCDKENLQVVCIPCHKIKTDKEKGERTKGSTLSNLM